MVLNLLESKPPAAWLVRKDVSVVLELCKHVYISSRGKKEVNWSEMTYG